jgi:hypothetical protein
LVKPRVPDALPHSTLGNTASQIAEVFNHHLQMNITGGCKRFDRR